MAYQSIYPRTVECSICGHPEIVYMEGPARNGQPKEPICVECYMTWMRTSSVTFDLLPLLDQIDILAASVLGEDGPVPTLEEIQDWARQLRMDAAPLLSYIYGTEVPEAPEVGEPAAVEEPEEEIPF